MVIKITIMILIMTMTMTTLALARQVRVTVVHELYEGLPVLSKWVVVANDGRRQIVVDRLVSERLRVPEHQVRGRGGGGGGGGGDDVEQEEGG
jgi:uncharacterized membrane protein YhhN